MVEADNPFSMPPEAEFFWLHNQNAGKSEAFQAERRLKVWEKTTSASRHAATKALREEDLPQITDSDLPPKPKALEEVKPDHSFLTSIATRPAVGLLNPLKMNQTDIRSYVSKKREVFLVQMALDVKKAEILRLDEKARMKEEALTKSQQILDEDTRKFDEFLQKRYATAQATMKHAEAQSKLKQEKISQTKQLKRDIANLQSEIGKFTEMRAESTRYKAFLEKLTPTEWHEQQRELKRGRKQRRRQQWIAEQMKGILEKIAGDEEAQERAAEEHEESKKKAGGRRPRKQELEEERIRLEKERGARKRRFQKKREDEQKRIAASFEEVSSEEEPELYFKESRQLMETFTELEEKNLFLIQSSQETEQMLDELQQNFHTTKRDLEAKVLQLRDSIKQLDQNINLEKKRGDELIISYEEKAGMQVQEAKLADLFSKVQHVYARCNLSTDHDPDTLQMLGSIEARLEELIHRLEDTYHQDSELVKRLEWQKQKERREKLRTERQQYFAMKQEERLKISLQRSQNPVFKKAGKQVMYRSPPLRQEKRVVRDTSEEEANKHAHSVFGVYIDKNSMPHTEAPVVEDPRKATSSRVLALRAAAAERAAAANGEASPATEDGAAEAGDGTVDETLLPEAIEDGAVG